MSQFVATCAVEERGQTCGAPTQSFLCDSHRDELVSWLWDIGGVKLDDRGEYLPSLLDELDTTISGDDKIGGAHIGIVVRSAETPLPFNERASETKAYLCNAVVGWTRLFAEDNQHLMFDVTTVEQAARWMASFPNLLAGQTAAAEMHDEIRRWVTSARRAIDRPAQRVFLGECGGEFQGVRCDAPLFALDGNYEARCRVCSTEFRIVDRRRSMLNLLEDRLAHSGDLAALVRANGQPMASSTIRTYAQVGKIAAKGKDKRGRPLYRVGDVMDVIHRRKENAA